MFFIRTNNLFNDHFLIIQYDTYLVLQAVWCHTFESRTAISTISHILNSSRNAGTTARHLERPLDNFFLFVQSDHSAQHVLLYTHWLVAGLEIRNGRARWILLSVKIIKKTIKYNILVSFWNNGVLLEVIDVNFAVLNVFRCFSYLIYFDFILIGGARSKVTTWSNRMQLNKKKA